jgi:hypothetical protein
VFPVARGRLTDIEEKATSILTKVDQLPLKAIGRDLQRSLATLGADARRDHRRSSNAGEAI